MKFTVEKECIVKALGDIISVVPSRSTLPILSNLLIKAEKDHLSITATDLEICIRKKIPTKAIQIGKITTPGKKIYDILKEIPDQEILIEETKNAGVIIRGEKCYFKLLGFSAEEYPEIPKIEGKGFKVKINILKKMISKTCFACSKEETRYVLNGILFDFQEKRLRLVASDGRRLAMYQEDIEVGWDGKYIIPQKAVMELLKIMDGADEVVTINISQKNNQISFHCNNTELITRLIEGDFPNYEEVIPKESENKLRIQTEDFSRAIKRASLMTTSDSIAIKLEFYKNKIVISKITPDLGEGREEIEASYDGDEMVVGFNPQYLLDVLKNIETQEVCFELNGADKPGIIRLDSKYIYLVLPMQLV
ncbi:MAG: DNA polymerase III subunit beta [Candidatus Saelkia tenebricola]|nr:DNA polymerase III subunit beta [Candidatus Saelkia tenebricola]